MTDSKNILGNNLRKIRLSKQMKIGQVADLLCVTEHHWSIVERGKQPPSLECLILFCQKFNTSLSALFSENKEKLSTNVPEIPSPLVKLTSNEFVCLNSILEVLTQNNEEKIGTINTQIMGKRLRKARNKKGITLRNMARQTKLTWGYLQNLEKGKSIPSLKTLQKLTTCLEISPDYLFANELPTSKNLLYEEFLESFSKRTKEKQQIAKNFIEASPFSKRNG